VKRTLAVLALAGTLAATQCGCLCAHAVVTGGTHLRHLKPTGVWTDGQARVMVECSVLDLQLLSCNSQSLGTRLVCASPATWQSAIEAEVGKQQRDAERYRGPSTIDHIFLRPAVALPATTGANVFAGNFVLLPSDITTLSDAEPPGSGWVRHGIPVNASCPSWPANVGGRVVTVHVDGVVLPQEARRYKDWWWYPNQVLLLPACAVDVVTSPIQFLMIIHSLGKIDG